MRPYLLLGLLFSSLNLQAQMSFSSLEDLKKSGSHHLVSDIPTNSVVDFTKVKPALTIPKLDLCTQVLSSRSEDPKSWEFVRCKICVSPRSAEPIEFARPMKIIRPAYQNRDMLWTFDLEGGSAKLHCAFNTKAKNPFSHESSERPVDKPDLVSFLVELNKINMDLKVRKIQSTQVQPPQEGEATAASASTSEPRAKARKPAAKTGH